ncbi:TPA_asm: hypothetical protein HUJ06_032018 [Nelumbo nucifera]|uniref:Alpha/beta hydrolase fold-3 domain-containing protein n=1 Tax=Nelumbo nucifera TaxID=4432 RepID=A0A822ZY35_NELNU|nr:TPA_asm: hypothetical protein HUJ06_032018 [Nelumbo nucifera]
MVLEKKLVEEVACWLKLYDDGSVDRTWSGPPEAKFMAQPIQPHEEFIDGVAVRDLTINADSDLAIRIYKPEKKAEDLEKFPILVHFHGGGFCISEPEWFMYYNIYTPCDDCYSVLLWLQAVARGKLSEPWLEAEADFKRVFFIGDSSGGNLVHEVAARAGNEEIEPLQLAGGIPIHPGFIRAERSRSELENESDSPFLTLEMVDKFMFFALPVGSTKDHPITCPMGSAAPPLSGLKLPPFLLVVAEKDLIRDTEMEYYEAMKKAGKDIELLINTGMGHSFYLNKIAIDADPNTASQTEHLITEITNFIKRH